eukprot:TRINITY_DN32836_c0_g1_i1.p1 TRINITY_DN32836_c0_g1~~TRINITY_DN32836_c0_g1_i1.p1  ORF type:complete len:423 (-),score=34.81 TRINITY_DN32836_c0_g1_i1:78-1346(-)
MAARILVFLSLLVCASAVAVDLVPQETDFSLMTHSVVAEQVFAHKAAWSGPMQSSVNPDIVVAQDGSGNFKSIQDAIDYVFPYAVKPQKTVIYVKQGTYVEEVIIPSSKRFITLVGDAGQTRIRFNKYSAKLNSSGVAMGTANTGSLTNLADDFTMINMVVENSSPRPPPGLFGYQAVAFRNSGNRTIIFNSSFYSFQDTLYAHEGYQYYKDCYIFGEIDFVFGAASAIFDSCTFYMDSVGYSGIFAQKKDTANEDNCFVVMNSQITGKNRGWLGRAWGKYSCTIIAYSYIDKVISPDGWNDFGVTARQVTSFFAEYKNRGLGSNLDGRVWWQKVVSTRQIKKYLTTNYIALSTWIRPMVTINKAVAKPQLAPGYVPPAAAKWKKCKADPTDSADKKSKTCSKCCKRKASPTQQRSCMNYCN